MAGKFCVTLTCAKDNTDKATVAFVIANAALGSEKETLVFLTNEGVRLSQRGYADDIHEEGFAPLRELMSNFAASGGTVSMRSGAADVELMMARPRGARFSPVSMAARLVVSKEIAALPMTDPSSRFSSAMMTTFRSFGPSADVVAVVGAACEAVPDP